VVNKSCGKKKLKIILILYDTNVPKLQQKKKCYRSYIKSTAGVKVLSPVTLIWYKMTGKSALSVTKSAIEKKLRGQSLSNFLRMLLTLLAFI